MKYVNLTEFSRSPYTAQHLKEQLCKAVASGDVDHGGVLAFVVSEDTSEVKLRVGVKSDAQLPTVHVTNLLGAYREYLVRCVNKTSSISVPNSDDEMYADLWNAFGATAIANWGEDQNTPDLQILSEILTGAYGGDIILICKINFSVKKDSMKIWDLAFAHKSDFIPTLH